MNSPSRPSKISSRTCPACGKPGQEKTRPFCSVRCAQIDLGRWLKGSYRVPTQEAPMEGDPEDMPRDEDGE